MKQSDKVKFLINKEVIITTISSYSFVGLGAITVILGFVFYIPLIFIGVVFILTYISLRDKRKFSNSLKEVRSYLDNDLEKSYTLLKSEISYLESTIDTPSNGISRGSIRSLNHIANANRQNRRNRKSNMKKLAQLIRMRDLVKEFLDEKKQKLQSLIIK